MSSRTAPRHRAVTRRRLPRVALGAVAAAVAGVLLLGGPGSLAYWTTSKPAPGGSFSSGSLAISAPTCGSWQLIQTGGTVSGTPSPNPTTYTNQPLQPNDVLTLTCTSTLTLQGDHMGGTIQLVNGSTPPAAPLTLNGTPTQTNGSAGTVTYPVITITPTSGTAHGASFTSADNGATVTAKIAISIPNTNTSNPAADATGTWNASQLRLVATQVHP